MNYNRSFMEFLWLEMNLDNLYIASIRIGDDEYEFSYLEEEYMDESRLYDIQSTYSEEFGKMSDFDFYPYGLV